ncbi:hypothetical protein [Nocardiopsis changdeensis]|uniref:Uncharacterized protein n=1 Tax=Nocardiopsis changdeensis TaxID=2831969 RepID=A0ABX8BWB4_9ACTN|nr:hypothetical protein [Nocardiopsis changdeensis]QUX26364.1 hypothetical protein KGD84_32200 [Nocardiopsis changdeensis]
MGLFDRRPTPEQQLALQEEQRRQAAEHQALIDRHAQQAQARRIRQVRVTAADIPEIKSICLSALHAMNPPGISLQRIAISEAKLTRGGMIVRGFLHGYTIDYSDKAPAEMRRALEDLGFVVGKNFGRDGVIVTGWDPRHYEGDQLTAARVQVRVTELREVHEELLELEASQVDVRDA